MGTGSLVKTDIYHLNNIVQNTFLSHAKNVFIEMFRNEFSLDSYFHYVKDAWGFAKINNHTGQPLEAGISDDTTSRIFIGESWHYNLPFYPSILVKGGSFRSVPISMSRNEGLVHYGVTTVVDGYGNEKIFSTPEYFDLAGAWEGQITIDILAGDLQTRDELIGIVASIIQIIRFHEFIKAGVFIKPINISGPSESDDNNDKIYKQTITCDVRTEWRQQIPINSVVDALNFCVDFGNLENEDPVFAENLEARGTIDLLTVISEL